MKGMKIRSTGLSAKIVETWVASPSPCRRVERTRPCKGCRAGHAGPDGNTERLETGTGCQVHYRLHQHRLYDRHVCCHEQEKWNSLPKDIQKAFDDVSQEWIAVAVAKPGMTLTWKDISAPQELGNKVIKLPAAEKQNGKQPSNR